MVPKAWLDSLFLAKNRKGSTQKSEMWKRVRMSQDLTISDAEPGDAPRREGSRSRQTSRVGEKNGPSGTSLLKALRNDHETLLELMTSTPCSSSWQAKQSKARPFKSGWKLPILLFLLQQTLFVFPLYTILDCSGSVGMGSVGSWEPINF